MNKLQFIKSGLVAGLFINVSEYFVSAMVLQVPSESMMFWVVYRFALGFLVAAMYALLLRRDWTSGPKTAARAGIIVWFAAAGLNNVVLGFSVVAIVWILVETTVAGLLAGRVYGEA